MQGRTQGFQVREVMSSGFLIISRSRMGAALVKKGKSVPFSFPVATPLAQAPSPIWSVATLPPCSACFSRSIFSHPSSPDLAKVIFLESHIFSCYYVTGNLLMPDQPQGAICTVWCDSLCFSCSSRGALGLLLPTGNLHLDYLKSSPFKSALRSPACFFLLATPTF